jgi:hypothetical protein
MMIGNETYGKLTGKKAVDIVKKRRKELLKGSKKSKESIEKRTKTRKANGWNKNPESTKQKQSEAKRGKTFSKEHKESLSKAHRGLAGNFQGKTHSEESKEKIRIAKLGKKRGPYKKRSKIKKIINLNK